MKKVRPLILLATTLSLLSLSAETWAQGRDRHKTRPHSPAPKASPWRGDIHRFREHDYGSWRKGRWTHARHNGRLGWWWIVGDLWYFYTAPIYPHPDPYTPSTVIVESSPIIVRTAQPHYWYCSNPEGYYPYVPLCYSAWTKVVATATVVETPAPIAAPSAPIQPPAAEPVAESQADPDYQNLNAFAIEFTKIKSSDPQASTKLKNLERKVETFRKDLFNRDYNAMEVLRDTEDLKEKIAEQRQSLKN